MEVETIELPPKLCLDWRCGQDNSPELKKIKQATRGI